MAESNSEHVGINSSKATDRLNQWLLDNKIATKSQLGLAARESERLGVSLTDIVQKLGLVKSEDLALYRSQRAHTSTAKDYISGNNNNESTINLRRLVLSDELKNTIDYATCDKLKVVPLDLRDGRLIVASSNPFDLPTIKKLETISGKKIKALAASESDIALAVNRNYNVDEDLFNVAGSFLEMEEKDLINQTSEDPPMIRLAEQILLHAATREASDIHLHPEERFLRVRFRIDGILEEGLLLPNAIQSALIARFKISAQMDSAEDRLPQDGRIYFEVGTDRIDVRVSSLPTSNGESIVMRLLDQSSVSLELNKLGFSEDQRLSLNNILGEPHGVFLVTGPTGSGKTTTLYTMLSMIDAEERSIFTLEDPIEYRLPLTRQTQVKSEIGLNFSRGLRTLLRQDPDVILVGETRDQETAELMVRASLTGHLVFSTLHTNDAISAIPRLEDLGIPRYLISSSLIGLSAQRLIRRLCPLCRKEIEIPDVLLDDMKKISGNGAKLYEAVGCNACMGKGYSGRLSISEILRVDDGFKELIDSTSNYVELKNYFKNKGTNFMYEDALMKASAGLTSIEEVGRVLSLNKEKISEGLK